jgi:hypothetical protein
MNILEPAFLQVAEKEIARIGQWFYKTPMLISPARYEELETLQKLLHRAIRFFVTHYGEYEHLLPLSPKAKRIVHRGRPKGITAISSVSRSNENTAPAPRELPPRVHSR